MRKNLLIGAITNYTWDIIAPFFNSFKAAGFENCDCVMFVGNMSKRTINKMQSLGIDVRAIPDELLPGSIINIRWKIYYDFLKDNQDKYNMVLTADVRDVFFQRDLFSLCDNNKPFLGIAIEDGNLDETLNKKWIIDAYGQQVHDAIKDNRIICVGTVWGTADEFMEYSRVMADILNSEWANRPNIIEQGIGNYIIYYDKMFSDVLAPSTNQEGYVMTIGLTKRTDIKQDSEGNILNGKGEIAAVVHQYDRKPDIVEQVYAKHGQGTLFLFRLGMRHKDKLLGRTTAFLSSSLYWNGLASTLNGVIKRIKHRLHK